MPAGISRTTAGNFLMVALLVSPWMMPWSADAQVPDRNKPPAAGPPPSLNLPPIKHMHLANGMRVLVLEKHTVPVVQVTMVVNTGSAMETTEKAGLASMLATIMTDGAGQRDALQLADAIDYLGASLRVTAGQHTTSVALFTPVARLDSALALMADVVLRPTFPQADLDRRRKERLTTLLQWRDEPSALASVIFNRTLYGPDHPYGRPSMGDEQSLRLLQRSDLKEFYDTWFRPNNATIIVVGDVTDKAIGSTLEAAFGQWRSAKLPVHYLPTVAQVKSREVFIVDKPGAAQTEIRIGCIGVQRQTPDYYAITVMNTLLGGSFTSRLNNNIREIHGYSYGAHSSFIFRPQAGPFVASAAVQTAVTDSAVGEFMKELEGIRLPVADSELVRARNYVALSLPADFQSVTQIAAQLEELVIYNLPDNYFNRFTGTILSVTAADLERVAHRTIDPDRLVVILVGDRQQIETKVKALHLGPVHALTVRDVLGQAPDVQ
jgi:predicted Zn-dependent peptidase